MGRLPFLKWGGDVRCTLEGAGEGVRRFGRKRFLRRQKIEMVIAWPLAVLCFAGLRAQGCP